MITLTNSKGQEYRFTGEQGALMERLLMQNSEAKTAFLAAIVEFDTRRMNMITRVLAGERIPGYGCNPHYDAGQYKGSAIKWIEHEYQIAMEQLRAVLDGLEGTKPRPTTERGNEARHTLQKFPHLNSQISCTR